LCRCAGIQFSSRVNLSRRTLNLHGPKFCAGNYSPSFSIYKNSISSGRVNHRRDVGAPPRCNFAFALGETLTTIVSFVAAALFFNVEGALLAFGVSELAEAVHARGVALGLSAGTGT
jgi:hypothetical protein